MFKHQVCSLVIALLGVAACGAAPEDAAPAPSPGAGGLDGLSPELRAAALVGLEHLDAHAAVLGVGGRDQLRLARAFADERELTHARFQQTLGGVPVFGGEAIVHLRRDRSIAAVTNALVPHLEVSTVPALTAAQAIARALPPGACASCLAVPPAAELWVMRHADRDHLVWRVQLRLAGGTNRISLPVVFVDAHSGELVWQYDNLQTGSGPSLYSGTLSFETTPFAGAYYLEDLARRLGTFDGQSGAPHFGDADDLWDAAAQRAGIDAHYGAAQTWEYYRNVHGIDGIDGSGGPAARLAIDGATGLIASTVHYGSSYNNAFWDGSQMAYGDGDGVQFSPLVSLDVAGHEMTHGVTQHTAGLVYYGESGALNESCSDIFGAMIERYARGDSDAIWKVGDEVYTPAIPGDALRHIDAPHQASDKGYTVDDDPDHYSERYLGGADNGGVHINSGIANKTFHLLAVGGAHHRGGSMTGIGPDAAAAIWYKALTAYMTSSTTFARAGKATYDAAVALHGEGSPEAAAVVTAWGLTGIVVDLTPPEVAITAPADGATIVAPTTITASASDNVGVSAVELLIDGVVRGTDATSPFTYAWSPAVADNGPHTIAARAYDLAGGSAQSAPIAVTVALETVPPAVAVTAPAAGATVAGTVAVAVDATDNVAVARVEFYVDGVYRATDAAAPYSFAWDSTAVGNGPHALSAKAFDTVGNSAMSSAVSVTVDNDRTPPAVAITAPAAGATVAGTVAVAVAASDNVGVTRVELLVDGALVATDTAAPWQLAWDSAFSGNGAHSLVARAYDALANVGISSAVSVTAATPGLATYDPVLRAPRCATAGSVCDTGGLVNGRAALGPEPNTPNTLGGTCLDDTGGSYHASESLDRLRVYTTDGSPLTAGKPYTIEATVWASTSSSEYDLLDLYYTSTPATPVWTLLATLSVSATGARVMAWPFTLPQGTQHAIRAQFRFWGTPLSPCAVATTTDRDDLVFTAVTGPDTTPPTTSITSPAAGAVVSGTIPVTTATSDNVGVTSVDLLLDNKLIATATAAPWSFTWNTRTTPSKSHSLRTRARDAAGNIGLSPIVTVTVAN